MVVLQEIDRLERIFSAYRADSELRGWQETHGTPQTVSPELALVLEAAEEWRQKTGNAFHPAVEALTRIWRAASDRGTEPDADSLRPMVGELRRGPLWEVDPARGTATRLTRLPVTLNAIAKGFILDAACQAAAVQPGIQSVLVNIGGDIRQMGGSGAPVGIADPFAPHENAEGVGTIRLLNQGIATSGGYRRGFSLGDRWHSHVLDPRTGYPVEQVVSATVVAPSARIADALATAFSVLSPSDSLRLADGLPDVGALLISGDGQRQTNAAWDRRAEKITG